MQTELRCRHPQSWREAGRTQFSYHKVNYVNAKIEVGKQTNKRNKTHAYPILCSLYIVECVKSALCVCFRLSQPEASDGHPSSGRLPAQSRYTHQLLCFITNEKHSKCVDIQVCKTGCACVPVMGSVPPRGSNTVGCILQYLPSRPRKKEVEIVFINLIMAVLGRRQQRLPEWQSGTSRRPQYNFHCGVPLKFHRD